MASGTLVEYFHNKKLLCALCLSVDRKDQLQVRTEENREDKVPRAKVVLQSKETLAPDSDHQRIVEWLRAAAQRREQRAREVQLEDLWELASEEPQGLSLVDLASLQFSSPVCEHISGLYRALHHDRLWFVRKGDLYQARPAEQVQETRLRLQAEEERAREREQVMTWLRALWNGQPCEQAAPSKYLTWIREVALSGQEAPRFKDIQQLFKDLEIGGKDAAFKVMLKAGIWQPDEFLELHRCHPPIEFTPELVALAEQARDRLSDGLQDPDRLDLRHLEALTIDDEWTTEVDDALTLEELPEGGYRVGIHIADASAYVLPDTPLDEEALERGTTIYLPERKIRMLPDVLGDELCSLNVGEPRLAFSYLVDFDANLQRGASRMAPSIISVTRRMTYQEADGQLLAEASLRDRWCRLYDIALSLRQERQAAGAIMLPFPRANLRVEEMAGGEPTIVITRDEAEAPAQVTVSEMMILANRLSGEYLAEHGLAAVFRSQPNPEKAIPQDEPPTPENLHKWRRWMKRGELGLSPARHAGLGLEAYSQSTSPIRRYADLLSQRQLKTHLASGQPAYTLEQMEPLHQRLERTTHQAEQLERERKQFWTLRYLEQRRWAELDAVVLQNLPDKHLVQIIPVCYETDCPLVPRRPLPPGTRLKVRIEVAWPREQSLRVTPVLEDD